MPPSLFNLCPPSRAEENTETLVDTKKNGVKKKRGYVATVFLFSAKGFLKVAEHERLRINLPNLIFRKKTPPPTGVAIVGLK